jgi:hypothetical protein
MSLTRRGFVPLAMAAAAYGMPIPPAIAGPSPRASPEQPPRPATRFLLTLTVEAEAVAARAVASACGVFGHGELPREAVLIAHCAGSRHAVPVDVSALAMHADGSIRIALLTFALPAGTAPCEVKILAGAARVDLLDISLSGSGHA